MNWRYLWATNVAVIFVLCIWGRPLQHLVQEMVPLAWVGYAVTAALAIAVLYLVLRRGRVRPRPGQIASAGLAAVVLVLTFDMKRPEEKLHLLLFGALGFISIRVFGFWKGLGMCLAVAGFDELLQLYLPSRVGDFRDVGMNAVSGILGAVIGWQWAGVGSRCGQEAVGCSQ
ncbi:VanZ family protein [Desulfovermiculus halophilus]|uniref:VanZ family protein n=1 Tax=Desulfovermiculus halophilus TaxID=339722 RepID=UPI0013779D78|nr:VanZ family protein [Desulfovermiculus halophilus]